MNTTTPRIFIAATEQNYDIDRSLCSTEKGFPFCGIVLSDDIQPKGLMRKIRASPLPVVASPLDSYSIASRVLSMNVKTLPGDTEKIERIQKPVAIT